MGKKWSAARKAAASRVTRKRIAATKEEVLARNVRKANQSLDVNEAATAMAIDIISQMISVNSGAKTPKEALETLKVLAFTYFDRRNPDWRKAFNGLP
jgi:cytochrome P450